MFTLVDNSIVAKSQSPYRLNTYKRFAVVPMLVRLKLLNLPYYLSDSLADAREVASGAPDSL